ncbi:MAG: alpha/beta hydrolase-fold protein [Chthoniobacter sp.]|uniref:alpha/beta hydrolase family esterase n=1 Tax=Chthoniobacter sp. TaxID=2510640 RepID=UPI0032A8539C
MQGLFTLTAAEPQVMGWHITGETRAAVVYPPSVQAKNARAPLIFVFHGHGNDAWFSTKQFPFQELWPEAVIVCPQGLPTPSASDLHGERRGWQHQPGEVGDRDLKFFDAMLRTLRGKFRVDDQRIYAAGFSNGGFFDYILWAERGKLFAAFAPCAAALRPPLQLSTPKPVFVVAGELDERVPFVEQRKNIGTLRQINGCTGEGASWGDARATRYESSGGTPVVAFVHAGGHAVPHAATVLITKFFREHTLPAAPVKR